MEVPNDVIDQGALAVEDHLIAKQRSFAWVPLVDTMQGSTGSSPRLTKMLLAVDGSLNELKFENSATVSAQEPIGLNSALTQQNHDIRFFGSYDYFTDQMRGMFSVGHSAANVRFVSETHVVAITAILLPERQLLGFSPRSSLAVELGVNTQDDSGLLRGVGIGAAGAALTRYLIKGKI